MRILNKALLLAGLTLATPTVALAAGGGSGNPWLDLGFKFVNLGILVAILYFALRKTVKQGLIDRRDAIKDELVAAREAKAEAETKLAEYKEKISTFEREVAELRETFTAEGEEQKKRIIAEAQAAAETIKRNAEAAGAQEVKRAKDMLRTEAVAEALKTAERMLKEAYSAEDQKGAVAKAIEKIERTH